MNTCVVTGEGHNKKATLTGAKKKQFIIPSETFPLSSDLEIFTADNTEACEDDKIRKIFDDTPARSYRCYENHALLAKRLQAAGIPQERCQVYVGWWWISICQPTHHCITVIDNKYVLDFEKAGQSCDDGNLWEMNQEALMKSIMRFNGTQSLPDSRWSTFGKVNKRTIYLVSKCTPMDGLRAFEDVMKGLPKYTYFPGLSDWVEEDLEDRIEEMEHDDNE